MNSAREPCQLSRARLAAKATAAASSPGSAQRTTKTDARGPAWASISRRRWASTLTCVRRLRAAETTVLPPLSADSQGAH